MVIRSIQIKAIQKALGVPVNGKEDNLTQAAVKNFQLKNGLPGTGVIDDDVNELILGGDLTTDISDRYVGLYEDYFLRPGEYVEGPTKKQYIFLHHTAGWNNPYRVVDMWNGDSRGRIGTQFIVGGINPRTLDDSYDGVVLRCFEDENYAWHLGGSPIDRYMHKHSIGIELCSFGPLTKRDDKFYTYANTIVHESQVCELDFSFRGYRYWHKYSSTQLGKLRDLLYYINNTHGIDLSVGLKERLEVMHPKDAFDYYDEAVYGDIKGLLSHTNVREGKYDVFPQPELVDLITSL